MKKLVLISLLFLSGCSTLNQYPFFKDYSSTPPDWHWTTLEYGQLGATNAAIGVDWYISGSMGKAQSCNLENPIYGSHPSQETLVIYYASLFAIVNGGAVVLPQGWRDTWLLGWTGMESYINTSNANLRSNCLK